MHLHRFPVAVNEVLALHRDWSPNSYEEQFKMEAKALSQETNKSFAWLEPRDRRRVSNVYGIEDMSTVTYFLTTNSYICCFAYITPIPCQPFVTLTVTSPNYRLFSRH